MQAYLGHALQKEVLARSEKRWLDYGKGAKKKHSKNKDKSVRERAEHERQSRPAETKKTPKK
eukprot:447030-Hanusia_phi.AAC.1